MYAYLLTRNDIKNNIRALQFSRSFSPKRLAYKVDFGDFPHFITTNK